MTDASAVAAAAASAGRTYSSGHDRTARPRTQESWKCGRTADMNFVALPWPSCLSGLEAEC